MLQSCVCARTSSTQQPQCDIWESNSTDASMTIHVSRTVSGCFGVLRQIRSIRPSVTRHVLLSLLNHSSRTVEARLWQSHLAGLSDWSVKRLQSMMNAAARLVFSTRKHDATTPPLHDLHIGCECGSESNLNRRCSFVVRYMASPHHT